MRLSRRALLLALGAAPYAVQAAELPRIVCPLASAPTLLIPGLSQSVEARLVGSKIYGGLCRFDSEGVPQPELAAGWEISTDGLTYVFHLRPGVLWHDSGAVTAQDVAFSIVRFHRILQPQLGLDRVSDVRVVDARTAMVTLAAAFPPFLRQLDARSAPIVPQHVHDCPGFALDPRQVAPVGSGPFWMAEWLRLKRFEWSAGPKPAIGEIDCTVIPDPAARLAVLDRPGGLLVGEALGAADLSELRQQPTLAVEAEAEGCVAGLRLNPAVPPFDDVRVRRGLACSVDRAALLRDVWSGLGRIAAGPASPRDGESLPSFDPRAAAASFTEAGLRPDSEGIRLRLPHLVPPGEPWRRLATRLQAMLSHVGVELVPEAVTTAEWTRRVAAGKYVTAGFTTRQTGDPVLDLAAYLADAPSIGPMLVAGETIEAQLVLVREAARIWLVEPAVAVVRDRRLRLPGGVFGTFAAAGFAPDALP